MFGNTEQRKDIELRIETFDSLEDGRSLDAKERRESMDLKLKLDETLHQEEVYWRQRSK